MSSKAELELVQVRGWSEPIIRLVPIGHPFGAREKISLHDLATETLALPSQVERSGYSMQVEDLLRRHDVRLAERREVRHWNTAVSFAATGHAVSLCPATIVHAFTSVVMVTLEEEGAELVTWILYREDVPSPAVSLVLELAAEVASDSFV